MKTGIDVSKHQGDIDWKKVKESGIDFAILRVGYAQHLDEKFMKNVEGCLVNGIEIKGIYLFSYALNADQAVAEADFAIKQFNAAGLPKSVTIFFDLEYATVEYAEKKGVTIGKPECIAHTVAFCERLELNEYVAGVYFNLHYARTMYTQELLDQYIKWLADWTGAPDMEAPFHQFSSKGSVNGIYGNVDMNYYYGAVEVEPEPVPTPPIDIDINISIDELSIQIIKGDWGNGDERKAKLKEAGHNYNKTQIHVNKLLTMAKNVIAGKYGNGEERKTKLEAKGYDYDTVQAIVNLQSDY